MKGKIVQVSGPVVDVEFSDNNLPSIKDALYVINNGKKCVMEVSQHIGNNVVRCIMLAASEGLCKDMEVTATGSGISVPVGEKTLGRLFNVLGDTLDNGEKLDEEEIESLEIEEPKEEVIVTKPSSIEEISKLIENTLEQEPIDLTNFEEEQEKDAIISYDELVKRAGAKKIIYRAETKAEEKKEPVKVIKTEKKQEPFVNKKGEYAGTFKASQIVSPIYGVKKNDDINENFIDLEEFKLDETKSEEERENEFLGNLKTFRNNLD